MFMNMAVNWTMMEKDRGTAIPSQICPTEKVDTFTVINWKDNITLQKKKKGTNIVNVNNVQNFIVLSCNEIF